MSSKRKWTAADMPDQSGRVAIVTGGNSGIGYETGRALAGKGGRVVLAVRSLEKGRVAAAEIRGALPQAEVEVMHLDLASLDSVASFAAAFREKYGRLDLLINNAGVMGLPYQQTEDGFEMQLGVNHFGHFALTGRLLDMLLATPGSRVVTVSSGMHRMGKLDWDHLHDEEGYDRWGGYGRSKLANLLFTYELQRRLAAAGAETISVAAHPGYAATNLQGKTGRLVEKALMGVLNAVIAQSAAQGALPILYAAAAPAVSGGAYFGPDGLGESRGYPTRVESNETSHSTDSMKRLWEISEAATGIRYGLQPEPAA